MILFVPAIFISWALTQRIKLRALFRYIVIAPLVLSPVVVALLWKMLYDPQLGPINNLLHLVGLGALAIPWLGDTRTELIAIVIASAWQQLGHVGAPDLGRHGAHTERDPGSLAGGWRDRVATVLGSHAASTLEHPALTFHLVDHLFVAGLRPKSSSWRPPGGFAGAADVMVTTIYERAFRSNQWGLACAMATFLLFLIFALSLLTNRLTQRETVEF